MNPSPRRATAAWCLFDFANSPFTTIIITFAFAIYFREVVVHAPDNRSDLLWGVTNFLAMVTLVAASPVLGALADFSGRKKRFLMASTLLAVACTVPLYWVGPGDVLVSMALVTLGMIGFEAGYVFYNAFLPEVSKPEKVGAVSGWGWGAGYVGGLLFMLLAMPLLRQPLSEPAGVSAYRTCFLLVAVWFLVFALPAFFWLRESPPRGRAEHWGQYVTIGLGRVRDTLVHLRRYRETAKYILASTCFTDGISTVALYGGLYARTTIGFSAAEYVWLGVVLNLVAVPGALGAGYLADRIGPKRTIVATLVLWVCVVIGGCLAPNKAAFWMVAFGAAIGMGGTQAVGRSFMAQITPPERQAEFFGFYVLSGKFASMFGPLVFGAVSSWSGTQRLAMLSLLPFFLAGLVLMLSIDEKRAMKTAESVL